MQGQRNSVESFPEAFEFESGANSSNSSMDPQSLWDTMMLNPIQTQSMPEFVLSTGEASMAYMNVNNDDASQRTWRSGSASSSQIQQSRDSLVENKLDHGWRTPLRINAGGGPSVDERHFETSSMLSGGNVNINLNSSFVDDGKFFPQNSSLSDMRQNLEYAADRVGTAKEASESSQLHPYSSGHISSSIGFSSPCTSSLADVDPMPEDDRTGNLLDGRRLACKRKNIEGFPGPSPPSGNASSSQHGENILQHSTCHNYIPSTSFDISGSSVHRPVPSSPEDYLQGFGTIARGMASDCYPSASTVGSTESSHRNYRTRMNPTQQHDIYPPSLWSTPAIRHSHQWQLNQPSPSVPFSHSPEPVFGHGSSYAQSQHHLPSSSFSQTTYHLPWTGTYPRIGSSSSSFNVDEDMVDTRVEHNPGNFPVTSNLDFVPAVEARQMAQDPVNWNLGTRDISVASTSRAGSSSAIYPTLGSPWVPYHSRATQYPRSLSEAVHQSPFASASSESASQGMNFPMQHATHSYDSQELIQLRAGLRGLQPAPHVRSYTMERQSDAFPNAPLNTRSSTIREGRQRMISEIRLALESMRSANGLSFEDMFMFDRTVILAGAGDLHDRHRDMRLDVDNMSYEELLALGERIGDVNTGLTEETVSKCLKQRKYFMGSDELMDEEPCCICQEEYVQGEDLGILDCGHDFHTQCIKQWLLQKNLCPICKNTALVP